MDSKEYLLAGSFVAAAGLYWFFRQSKPYPPGPSRLPLIGSALSLPQTYQWETFWSWKEKYGDLIYLDAAGQPIVVINSSKIAIELMDKRSALYSDRPFLPMVNLANFDAVFVMKPYGDLWRTQRRQVAQDLSAKTVGKYRPIQEREARKLVRNVLRDPGSFEKQVKARIGAIILRVSYGYEMKDDEDRMLTLPLEGMEMFGRASEPGKWAVDIIPALRHLPEWMPGAGFKAIAQEMRKTMIEASWNPYLYAKKQFESGNAELPNMCASAFTEAETKPLENMDEVIVYAMSGVLGGGLDTNMSTVLTFAMWMVLRPDIQKRVHEEVDRVFGGSRLPAIEDLESLPFLRACITEGMRLAPPIPLSIPHRLKEDDIYEGHLLPKGSLIIPNVWGMLRDPSVYASPNVYDPDRYHLSSDEMSKVTDLVFGFGRRSCPGEIFASGTVGAICATLMSTSEIKPFVDRWGNEVLPSGEYTSATIVFPKRYEVNIVPRSKAAVELLHEGE